ncbi:MAG TPA: single-stranded-DNA-specific exonuclease RecJ [Candidatus Atribacteria bacterium]|nr:single-stranded-DNA-specific exonuclease RecJ [Candidatus Atribacteria bacterium]HPT79396.1 single-stranded-DNA-specific exonuclease RecJ [Candidatus Atribacteria bacterium]
MAVYELMSPALNNMDSTVLMLKYELAISEVAARLLVNRGITTPEEARLFLYPALSGLHDPYLLNGMDKAVERVKKAISSGEKIIVYGDYDVDGVTSTSMLYLYFRSINANSDIYIPNRKDEGYGLHLEALQALREQGAGLIITVDCGITAVDEINAMKPCLDIIVTDHHNPGETVPEAYAVINPKLPGQAYPFKDLAGVGVALKLVQALGGTAAVEEYIDLAAIGTIADVVPLTGEDRILAALGLKAVNERPRPGIKALTIALGYEDGIIDAGRVSFGIAPCLNAPGRMSSFRKGFELLTADNLDKAMPVAEALAAENNARKETENSILRSVFENIRHQTDPAREKVIVVCGEGWHPGVIGIAASRVVEQYNRPCVLISVNDGEGTASCRSIRGFNIYEALKSCRDLMTRFGGHEQAAGLSLPSANIDAFRKRICEYAEENINEDLLLPRHFYDGQLKPEDITPDLHREIEMLAPFGFGNPVPKFLIRSASVESRRLLGKDGKHLKLALGLGQRSWDAIGFNMAALDNELQLGCEVDLLASLKLNEWMGISTTQLQIHSLDRSYRSRRDLEKLLEMFYDKLFNAFFAEFMYNDNVVITETAGSSNTLEEISLDDFHALLESCKFGVAVLVHTPCAAQALLGYLLSHGALDKVAVRYNVPCIGDGAGRNTILLAPDMTAFPAENYHTVIVPDSETGFADRIRRFNACPDGKRFMIIADGMHLKASPYHMELELTREQFEVFYKWLRAAKPGRNYWTDTCHLSASFKADTGVELNSFQLLLALEVFKELNFIALESGTHYIRVNCVKNPKSRKLAESRIFAFHRAWLAGLIQMNNH